MQPLLQFFWQIVNLVVDPQASVVYHVLILLCLTVTAIVALLNLRQNRVMGRLALAAGSLLLLRLGLLAVENFSGQYINALVVLPPLDRAASAFAIVLLTWAFSFSTGKRAADAGTLLLLLAIAVALGLSWVLWDQEVSAGAAVYNFGNLTDAAGNIIGSIGSRQETLWEQAKIVLIVLGIALVIFRHEVDWPLGGVTLILLLVGHIIHYLGPTPGLLPGPERLLDIMAYPLFMVLAFRSIQLPQPVSPPAPSLPPGEGTEPFGVTTAETDPRLVLMQQELEKLRAQVAAAQQEKQAIETAFQQVRSDASTLDQELHSQLSAEARQHSLLAELDTLRARLQEAEQKADELNRLKKEYEAVALLAEKHRKRETELDTELERAQAALQAASERMNELEEHTTAESEDSEAELAAAQAALRLAQKQLSEKERLLTEAKALRQMSAGSAQPMLDEILTLTQEFRQPVKSISGYTDLLLGETTGMLGPAQRKFIERIKASCARLEVSFNDLVHMTDPTVSQQTLKRENLDLLQIIDDAVKESEALLHEKKINLRLDLADRMPPLPADREALRQILHYLLNNAVLASPPSGEVEIKARHEYQQSQPKERTECIVISVRDSGGGLTPNDQARVFLHAPGTAAQPVPGLGDPGEGLFNAKSLTEALGGLIWLSCEEGKGSTFAVLLPITQPAAEENAPAA